MNDKKNTSVEFYPSALTIAGSDSGGGAGIQADLRTFNAYGIFGCSAITAVTAQNPLEVTGITPIPAEMVTLQIDTVLKEIPIKYAKSGMIPNTECAEAVADAVKKHRIFLICDPVAVASSGTALQKKETLQAMKNILFPHCKWITPNIPEAEILLNKKINSYNAMLDAARELYETTNCSVLLKGGHLENRNTVSDVICCKGEIFVLKSPLADLDTVSESHGSGCTVSAAFTAGLAMGMDWKNAMIDAKAFVLGSMRETAKIGPDIFAMYPPTEDCRHEITLSALKKKK